MEEAKNPSHWGMPERTRDVLAGERQTNIGTQLQAFKGLSNRRVIFSTQAFWWGFSPVSFGLTQEGIRPIQSNRNGCSVRTWAPWAYAGWPFYLLGKRLLTSTALFRISRTSHMHNPNYILIWCLSSKVTCYTSQIHSFSKYQAFMSEHEHFQAWTRHGLSLYVAHSAVEEAALWTHFYSTCYSTSPKKG